MNLVELPNGVETSFTYDDGDRLTDIEHMPGLDTLAFVNYTLDNLGNRTQCVGGYTVVGASSFGGQIPW